ncbi:MAG: hypothetical protein U5K51_17465 [Flavobacteriaceae bacterium]|nr:hypothetical protein [Flavobacteriaceae bacterium]
MKKIIKRGVSIAIMLAVMFGYANENDLLLNKNKKKTVITLKNVKKGSILTLKDAAGMTLYEESISNDGKYDKVFNFNALPEGNYQIEVDEFTMIKVIPVTVKADGIYIHSDKTSFINKPLFKISNSEVLLTKLAADGKSMKIKLFYNGVDLIYDETTSADKAVAKKFDFSKAEKGSYHFQLNSADRSFTKVVNF